jgi:GH15 family glucan-1,4-alpha-glucosidase
MRTWIALALVLALAGCPTTEDPSDDDTTGGQPDDDDDVTSDDDDTTAADDDTADDDDTTSADDDTSDDDLDDDLGYACDIAFTPLAAPPSPSRSFHALPTSNGYVSATYATDLYGVPVTYAGGFPGVSDMHHRLYTFTEHVMARPNPSEVTRDLLFDLYLGIRVDGNGTWLSEVNESEAGYVPGTGIVRFVQHVDGLDIETYIFAPFHGESYALVVVGRVINSDAAVHAVDLYSLQNFHAGGEGTADGENVSLQGTDAIAETRVWDVLLHRSIGAPTHYGAAPAGGDDNPWGRLAAGQDLTDGLVSGDDVAAGFQWSMASLDAGDEAWGGLVVGFNGNGEDAGALASRVDAFVAGRTPQQVVEDEQAFWDGYHAVETPPAGLSADELAVYRQSTAVLKMGQVREPGSGYGQVLASLPPGGWNISWPRDAAYAIVALARSGHLDEARDALQFQIGGDAGYYASYLGISDYLISACRYHGDGTEESDGASCPDGSDAGPNVELDDFGLFLWAYGAYLDASGDTDFENDTLTAVLEGVADPLVALIDPAQDLLVADSSIWERHWEECFPNGRKHFSYSDVQAVHGLRVAHELSGDPVYEVAAERIRGGLLDLSDGPAFEETFDGAACPVLASAVEEVCGFCGPYDASVIEAVNLEVFRPDSSMAKGTMRALSEHLAMGNGSPGFLRNDDGAGTTNPHPWYDDQEWVVIDLRMAAAMAVMGEALGDPTLTANAEVVVDWITALARENADLIGELLSDGVYTAEDDADHTNLGWDNGYEYQGSVPMCGFGPGAYILALEQIHL